MTNRPATLVASFALAALIVSLASPVDAQARRPGAGAVRLGADAQILDVRLFPDRDEHVTFGLAGRGLGPSFAYAITDMILIGARVAFALTWINPPGPGDSTSGAISVLPFLEFAFGEGPIVPFVGGQIGFSAVFPDPGDAYANVIGGAFGGVHIMLANNFSLSPFGEVGFVHRGVDEHAAFNLALGLSLMGWIGDVRQTVSDVTQ